MKFVRYVDSVLLCILSLASILIAVCDYFNWFQGVAAFTNPNYITILIVLVSLIGIHLAVVHVERLPFRDSLDGGAKAILAGFHASATELIRGIRGASVRVFKDAAEQDLYLAERIRQAHVEVCDLSWKENISRESALSHRIKAHKSFEAALAKTAARIPYREVFVFSDEKRREKLKRRLAENVVGYSCRYFPDPGPVPRLQFVVIDKEEVVFASSSYPRLCSITQAELAVIFQAYFEAIWNSATPLKEATQVYKDEVRTVLEGPLVSHPPVKGS